MRTGEEECLESLREATARLGESPTKAEYDELDLRPSSTTITRVLGSWNNAKEAAGLETFEQGENGGTEIQPKPDHIELPEGVSWRGLTAQQRWYYKNRRHRIAVKEKRRRGLHRWLYELKRDELDCSDCGEGCPPALDFHHPGPKEHAVSEMANDGYSRASIRAEIAECLVLCANCHRREHHAGPHPSSLPSLDVLETVIAEASGHRARRKRREWLSRYKLDRSGCRYCTVTEPLCLEFHHVGAKRDGIGRLVSHGHTLEEIRNELRNCRLVCANCHRALHSDPPSPAHYDTHK